MNRTYDKFQVVLLSEVKGKDSNAFIFELRLTSEDNCRIRIIDFDAFDIDGNKYSAGADKISTTDVILGHSKFFAETKKINVKISSQFKARIGCMAVLTVACIEDKQQMKFCFQRKEQTAGIVSVWNLWSMKVFRQQKKNRWKQRRL